LEAVDILDAAGFDIVIIETVGVGQDEVDIARAAHTTVVVSPPGLGDEIQAIKAGILEIADIHVVSKCDRPDADKTVADLKNMLALRLALARDAGWQICVVPTSSQRAEGIAELAVAIDRHWQALNASGEIVQRRALIAQRRLLAAAEEILRDEFVRHRDGHLSELLAALAARETSPRSAAIKLLQQLHLGGEQ
jgi:LAO/AO transport system kinase